MPQLFRSTLHKVDCNLPLAQVSLPPNPETLSLSHLTLMMIVMELPALRPNLSSPRSLRASIRSSRATRLRRLRPSRTPRPFKRLTPRISSLRPTSRLTAFSNLVLPMLISYRMSMRITPKKLLLLTRPMMKMLPESQSRPLLLQLATKKPRMI